MSVSGTVIEMDLHDPEPAATKPFWVKCRDEKCGHCWPAAYAPMEMAKFAKAAAANARYCPKCGEPNALVAKQTDGILEEPQKPA